LRGAIFETCATHVHNNLRDTNGRYPRRWDQPPSEPINAYMLIDQASAARAYFVLANVLKEVEAAGSSGREAR